MPGCPSKACSDGVEAVPAESGRTIFPHEHPAEVANVNFSQPLDGQSSGSSD
jgi:hypothetical protein